RHKVVLKIPPPVAKGTRLQTSAKRKQPAKSSKAKGLIVLFKVALTEAEQMKLDTKRSLTQTHISQASGSGVDEGTGLIPGVPDVPTYEFDEEISSKSSNDDASHGMNVRGDKGPDAEDDDNELYGDVNINLEGRDVQMTDLHTTQVLKHSCDPNSDVPVTTTVEPLLLTAPTLPPSSVPIISQIIKEQVKEQVKVQVSKILAKIKKTINDKLEAEVLTRASNSSKTSYDMAADQSGLELKKIIIEKMERNKSIHRSDEQRNLYKDLINAYECDKIILDTYGDTVTLKRRHDDKDKDEEPSAGSDRGYKKRRAGKDLELTSAPKEKASKTSRKSIKGSKSHQKNASKSAPAEEPMQTTQDLEEPAHIEFETGAADDQPIAEASQHPEWFQKQTKLQTPDHTLTPELLAGPTYELMKGSCKSLVELEFFLKKVYKATTDQLDWNNPEGQQYLHDLLKPLPLRPNS
nr:hypothetical protein [Tanacetum cinerariifolium]